MADINGIAGLWGQLDADRRNKVLRGLSDEDKRGLLAQLKNPQSSQIEAAKAQNAKNEALINRLNPPKEGVGGGFLDTSVRALPGLLEGLLPNTSTFLPGGQDAAREPIRQEHARNGLLSFGEGGFGGSVLETLKQGVESVPGGKFVTGVLGGSNRQVGKSVEAFGRGDVMEGMDRVSSAIPVGGPILDMLADTAITQDNPARAVGQAAGILSTALLPPVLRAAKPITRRAQGVLSTGIRNSAVKTIENVVKPTTALARAQLERIKQGILDRKVMQGTFTLKGLRDKATRGRESAGAAIDAAWDALPGNTMVPVKPVIAALRKRAQDFKANRVNPNPQVDLAISQGDDLIARLNRASEKKTELLPNNLFGKQFISENLSLSPKQVSTGKISIDALRQFRREFDEVSRQSGGFGVGDPNFQSSGAVQSIAANASRDVINSRFPHIAKLNKEFGFWKDLEEAVGATVKRKAGQESLGNKIFTGAGLTAGAHVAGFEGAVLGAAAAKSAASLGHLPATRMRFAGLKNNLADSVANFDPARAGVLASLAPIQAGLLFQGQR